jgi:hypothetical protein
MSKAPKLTPLPVSSLTAHLRPGPESVRDAPQRWSQSRVVAQQHGGHVGIVYPLYPYLGVGMLVVVGREKAVAVESRFWAMTARTVLTVEMIAAVVAARRGSCPRSPAIRAAVASRAWITGATRREWARTPLSRSSNWRR